ncbi:hypothetical protein BSKO_10108 [Bryopsis sp. KO-2023]|nr:hypothetical protein BSKO_10108 [Bryopsis sp. KO-2023]
MEVSTCPEDCLTKGCPAEEYKLEIVPDLTLAAALFSLNGVLSIYLSLGLNRKLITAALRCVVQLSVLGLVLNPTFEHPSWVPVILVIMILVAAIEVMSRPSYSYSGMYYHILLGVGGSTIVVVVFARYCVIRWEGSRWFEPKYLIPLVGMLLGNTISGVSLGLTTVLEELAAGGERVEVLLSMGANRLEATKGVIQRSLHVALVPMINQMSVVGIVSLPGMMTGQMLAGADPVQASYYQMAILFLIGTTTALGSIVCVLLAVCWSVDADHRLRSDRLHLRNRPAGIQVWAISQTMKAIERMRQFGKRVYVAGRGGIRRSWYSDAPSRSWAYNPINGEDMEELGDEGLGPVGSDIGSDDVFSNGTGQFFREHDGDGHGVKSDVVIVPDGGGK